MGQHQYNVPHYSLLCWFLLSAGVWVIRGRETAITKITLALFDSSGQAEFPSESFKTVLRLAVKYINVQSESNTTTPSLLFFPGVRQPK